MLRQSKNYGTHSSSDAQHLGGTVGGASSTTSKLTSRTKRRQKLNGSHSRGELRTLAGANGGASIMATKPMPPPKRRQKLTDTQYATESHKDVGVKGAAPLHGKKAKHSLEQRPKSKNGAQTNGVLQLNSSTIRGVPSRSSQKPKMDTERPTNSEIGSHPNCDNLSRRGTKSAPSKRPTKPTRGTRGRTNSKSGSLNLYANQCDLGTQSKEPFAQAESNAASAPCTNYRKKSTSNVIARVPPISCEAEAPNPPTKTITATEPLQVFSESKCHAQANLTPIPKRRTPSATKANAVASSDTFNEAHIGEDSHIVIGNIEADGEVDARFADPAMRKLVDLLKLRESWHRAEKKLTLAMSAICRSFVGCKGRDDTKGNKLAAELLDRIEKEKATPEEAAPEIGCVPLLLGRQPIRKERREVDRTLAKLAAQLPVAAWAEAVPGFGMLSLAKLVGSTGDISAYRTVQGLWKRMGRAVFDGRRQRKCTDAIEALRQGYSPPRGAIMWDIGQHICGVMKGYRPIVGEDLDQRTELSKYELMYLKRLRYEAAKNPEHARPPVEKDGVLKESFSKHAALMARRYTEKQLLKDLWVVWRAIKRGEY